MIERRKAQGNWLLPAALAGSLALGVAAPPGVLAGPPAEHALASAAQLGDAFASVAERISPAVVSIQVEAVVQAPRGFGFGMFGPMQPDASVTRGGGSGVVISADGDILTNNHVVENARRIEVHLNDGRKFPAKVVGTDAATDLAVLHIDAKHLPAARFANSDRARVGEWVVAVGSPFGLDYTVTAGVLSAKGRGGLGASEIEDYLQTDASINPGNSGGPLVNLEGEVLGINAMILGRASVGIGFAIPSNLARQVANQLREHGEVQRAWIGVSYQELTPELASQFGSSRYRGALVNQTVAQGPADRAGLRAGDIVLAVGDDEVREGSDLQRYVLRHGVGETVPVTVLRSGKELKLSVVTRERPGREHAQSKQGRTSQASQKGAASPLGMALSPLSPNLARRLRYSGPGGVVVGEVRPGSAAERAGVAAGDVIEQVDRQAVDSVADVAKALSQGHGLLTVRRHGSTFFTVLQD